MPASAGIFFWVKCKIITGIIKNMANIVLEVINMMNNKKIFLFIALAALLVFAYFNQNLAGGNTLSADKGLNPLEAAEADSETAQAEPKIIVHLSGAVKNAGVYELENRARLVDLIKLAGGLKEKADLAQINLAEEIFDGQKIIIPLKSAVNEIYTGGEQSLELGARTSNSSSYNLNQESSLLNINQASQADLEKFNGIGPAKASAIISYREENGHFEQKEDILKVSGIGEKTLANIEAEIRLK